MIQKETQISDMEKKEQTVVHDYMVELKDLCFSWPGKKVYDHVNINIPRGKITAIMGPSGTGKTTLLKLIGRQLQPNHGDILFEGKSLLNLSTKQLYEQRKKMGMLFQSGALFTDMSVYENVAFPIREHTQLSEEIIRPLVLMKLEAVGLRGARDLFPSELSGGMARRAALARAIALDPLMIMYDEPFAGQDPISMAVIVKLIKLLNDSLGLTSIIVSHDVDEVCSIADYVYVTAESKIIGEGTPQQLKSQNSKEVTQFIQGLSDGPVPFHFPAENYRKDLLG